MRIFIYRLYSSWLRQLLLLIFVLFRLSNATQKKKEYN